MPAGTLIINARQVNEGRQFEGDLRIEDGRGRPLGRAYQVKLWPTLILLRVGRELARVVRPREARDLWPLEQALA